MVRKLELDRLEINNTFICSKENEDNLEGWRLDPCRFSNWDRLRNVMAWVLRFIQNCNTSKEFRETDELKCYELKESEEKLTIDAQKQFVEYQDIKKGKPV